MNILQIRFMLLVLGPIIGSFLGVVIRRLPAGRSIARGRSACESCGHRLAARDLVPLFSYAALGGKCRYCRAAIGRFHPHIELAALGVAAIVCGVTDDPARLWLGCLLGWMLLALGWIDLDHQRLPDALSLPLLLAGLAGTWVLNPEELTDHAEAAAIGYLAFRGLALAYRRLRGREGLGQGDAKLLAAGGAWVGLAPLPTVVLIAAVATLATVLVVARGRPISRTTAIPFGPGLALAIWAVWLAG